MISFDGDTSKIISSEVENITLLSNGSSLVIPVELGMTSLSRTILSIKEYNLHKGWVLRLIVESGPIPPLRWWLSNSPQMPQRIAL